MKRKQADPTIKHDDDEPIAAEILAASIVAVSRGMKRLLEGPLMENAIVLLIQDGAGGRGRVSQEDIRTVLKTAARLEELYVRKTVGKKAR